jgi:hypothetical protein
MSAVGEKCVRKLAGSSLDVLQHRRDRTDVRALVRDLHADDRLRSSVGRAGGLYNPPEQARARIGGDRLLQRLEAEQSLHAKRLARPDPLLVYDHPVQHPPVADCSIRQAGAIDFWADLQLGYSSKQQRKPTENSLKVASTV